MIKPFGKYILLAFCATLVLPACSSSNQGKSEQKVPEVKDLYLNPESTDQKRDPTEAMMGKLFKWQPEYPGSEPITPLKTPESHIKLHVSDGLILNNSAFVEGHTITIPVKRSRFFLELDREDYRRHLMKLENEQARKQYESQEPK